MGTQKKPAKAIKKDEPPKNQVPPAAECAKISKGRDKAAIKQKAAAELATELKNLRAALKEIVKQASLRIDDRIADTLRALEKKQAPGAKASLQLTKKLQGLKLKPARGRLKDIAHIRQLVDKIAGKLPDQS